MSSVLVFDMDGVLVDVSESYRETIVRTVQIFTGQAVSRELIQEYKNRGGWNNDWALSQRLIADVAGIYVPYETVVRRFQELFLGPGNDGLILRERWIPSNGLLHALSEMHALCIFTGRVRKEAQITLGRFVPDLRWSMVVGDDDVQNSKPAPDGLYTIAAGHEGSRLTYFGDTVDDARSARAAGVRFIGVAHANHPNRSELVQILSSEGAEVVLEDINQIQQVL
jgi:HAD superfamily phosphatase